MFKTIILSIVLMSSLFAKELEKVSLQLQWLDQFQFAGYYMAKKKGFYEEVGLEVVLKKYKHGVNIVDEVTSKRATYGIGRSSLVIDKSKGARIKILEAIFQSSPLIMLATEASNIKTIKDFKNRRVMTTSDAETTVSLRAMMNKGSIKASDIQYIEHTFQIDDLINGKTDLMASYISNEPFLLQEKGIKYRIFDPKDYGFDFYSELLFTSDSEIQNHKQRAINFKNASVKGWEYAFNHIDETVGIILNKYNRQNKSKEALTYEAKELKKLAYYNLGKNQKIGHIDRNKVQRIYDIYNVMGLLEKKIDIDEFIFHHDKYTSIDLTSKERRYLSNKKELTICVQKGYLPYESLKDGKFIGMSADYLNLYSKKLDIPLKSIMADSQIEYLKFLKQKKCDIKPLMGLQKATSIPYIPTKSQIENKVVLVTTISQAFVDNLHRLNTTIVMENELNEFIYVVKKEYPELKITEVDTIDTALKMVAKGEVFGYIGTTFASAYQIQKKYSTRLKIINDFNSFNLGVGVRDDEPILLSILNKAISQTTQEEKQHIINSWIVRTIDKEQDHTLVWQLSILFLLILWIIIFFLLKEHKLKSNIELLNNTLEERVSQATIELKKQNSELQEKSNSFRNLLNAAMESIAIFDENYNLVQINQSGIEMFGYEPQEEVIGINILGFIPEYELPKILESSAKEVSEPFEVSFYKKDKTLFPTLSAGRDIMIDGKKMRIVTIMDLTKIKEKEQQLFSQSRLAQMGEMISMIAHQWRQPLGAISTTAANLKLKLELESFELNTEESKGECSEYFINRLENIDNYVENLTTTIDDFRNFYKPNKDAKSVKLEEILAKTFNIIKASLSSEGIEIAYTCDATQELVIYDSELMQVLLNILKNAQDNFKEKNIHKPKLIIKVHDREISITDNGGGIPQDIIEKIFDPYFSTKSEKNGTGLGLYMSKTIVEEHHNGKLEAFNVDDGVCFKIKIEGNVNGKS